MKHPSSKQVRYVAAQLTRAMEEFPNATFDMRYGTVKESGEVNTCGTAFCHGGWYALATCDLHTPRSISFTEGASNMARDLGFTYEYELLNWAQQNSEIWGNEYGSAMFASHPDAFLDENRNFPRSLCDVRNHWLRVAERLEKLEAKEAVAVCHP